MALFGFGKKKEEVQASCDCGGACESNTTESNGSGCCCGGNGIAETEKSSEASETSGLNDTEKKDEITVKVLGSGCAKCNQLEAAAKEALMMLGIDATIDHVTDFTQIAAYGVMSTPALVINDKVVSYGKVLKTEEVIRIIEKIRS